MILSAKLGDSLEAEFELNFTTNTWNLPPAPAKWGGVMYSDRGLFEVKSWGVIWLMDGNGSAQKSCTVILHDAPTDEKVCGTSQAAGGPMLQRSGSYKDESIKWQVLRRRSPGWRRPSSGALTKVRLKARQICEGLLLKPGKLSNGTPAAASFRTGHAPDAGGWSAEGAFESGSGTGTVFDHAAHVWEGSQAIDEKYKPAGKTWVQLRNRPKTGDIYTPPQFENKGCSASA